MIGVWPHIDNVPMTPPPAPRTPPHLNGRRVVAELAEVRLAEVRTPEEEEEEEEEEEFVDYNLLTTRN